MVCSASTLTAIIDGALLQYIIVRAACIFKMPFVLEQLYTMYMDAMT